MTTLDIISDPICPWCYIGKARLDKALEARPGHPFDIHWRPFQLNPDMPREGQDRRTYLEQKFGGPKGAARVYGQIAGVAKDAGLDVDLDAIARTPNTLDAHRLLRWARVEGCQTPVAGDLFHRYFKLGQDISDHQILADCAAAAGMDRQTTLRLLAGEADLELTRDEDNQARTMGVTGVPTFILGATYALQGAQETDVWLKVLDELAAAAAQKPAAT